MYLICPWPALLDSSPPAPVRLTLSTSPLLVVPAHGPELIRTGVADVPVGDGPPEGAVIVYVVSVPLDSRS